MSETANPTALHAQLAQAHQAWQNQQIELALQGRIRAAGQRIEV